MIRSIFRLIGFMLLAAAFASLVVDGTRSIAAHRAMVFSLGETLRWLSPSVMLEVDGLVSDGPMILTTFMMQVLRCPAWVVTGVGSLLLFIAGRRPNPDRALLRRL